MLIVKRTITTVSLNTFVYGKQNQFETDHDIAKMLALRLIDTPIDPEEDISLWELANNFTKAAHPEVIRQYLLAVLQGKAKSPAYKAKLTDSQKVIINRVNTSFGQVWASSVPTLEKVISEERARYAGTMSEDDVETAVVCGYMRSAITWARKAKGCNVNERFRFLADVIQGNENIPEAVFSAGVNFGVGDRISHIICRAAAVVKATGIDNMTEYTLCRIVENWTMPVGFEEDSAFNDVPEGEAKPVNAKVSGKALADHAFANGLSPEDVLNSNFSQFVASALIRGAEYGCDSSGVLRVGPASHLAIAYRPEFPAFVARCVARAVGVALARQWGSCKDRFVQREFVRDEPNVPEPTYRTIQF